MRFSDRLLTRRTTLLAGMAMVAACAKPGDAADRKTVLFICQFGSVKSAIARELFRAQAQARGLNVNVISRGITPEEHATQELQSRLKEAGIDTNRQPLTGLDTDTLRAADVVVLFDPLPPGMSRPDALDWRSTPSMNQDYPAARSYLDAHLGELLDQIK